jgi:hypothetical protein
MWVWQEDVDFIEFITSKMKAARMYWTDKTEALRDYLTDLSQGRDQHVSPLFCVDMIHHVSG